MLNIPRLLFKACKNFTSDCEQRNKRILEISDLLTSEKFWIKQRTELACDIEQLRDDLVRFRHKEISNKKDEEASLRLRLEEEEVKLSYCQSCIDDIRGESNTVLTDLSINTDRPVPPETARDDTHSEEELGLLLRNPTSQLLSQHQPSSSRHSSATANHSGSDHSGIYQSQPHRSPENDAQQDSQDESARDTEYRSGHRAGREAPRFSTAGGRSVEPTRTHTASPAIDPDKGDQWDDVAPPPPPQHIRQNQYHRPQDQHPYQRRQDCYGDQSGSQRCDDPKIYYSPGLHYSDCIPSAIASVGGSSQLQQQPRQHQHQHMMRYQSVEAQLSGGEDGCMQLLVTHTKTTTTTTQQVCTIERSQLCPVHSV